MQSVDGSALGAARAMHVDRAPTWLCLWIAAMAALTACAGPSPQVQVATADASQPATASPSASGQAAANESAAAASDQSKPDSTDMAASGNTPASSSTADSSTPSAAPSTPPPEPQATSDPAPAPATAPATDAAPATAAPEQQQPQAAAGAGDVSPPGSGLATGRPYVVIRFADSSVDYEKALSEAVKRAVARKPNLAFDLVAVTPQAGTADELADLTEKAHAEAASVMKSLSALGIGPERVSMMTWTGQPTDVNEIRLYIR
jgi:hypothetical protein